MDVEAAAKISSQGATLKQEGKIEEAIACYLDAIELHPNCYEYYYQLANILREQGQFVKASEYYREAIKIKPERSWPHHDLGRVLAQQGQLEAAIDCYHRAIELNPTFSWSYYDLGRILHQKNNLEAAKACYQKVIELDPDNPWAHDFLAEIVTKQEQSTSAIDGYHRSIALNSDYLAIYKTLGKSLLNLEPDQLVEYRQHLQINSDIERACIEVYLGQAWQDQNQSKQAISCYEKAIEIEPYFELPYKLISNIYGSSENHKNYQKFLILCHPRTGSNFLVSLLHSHPQIRAFGEMFSEDDELYWGYSGYSSPRIVDLKNEDPIFFIDQLVFRQNFPPLVKAVGFKLFYFQLKQGKQNIIWQYLKEIEDLKIIHLTRKNLFHIYISHQIAKKTNKWNLLQKEKNIQESPLLEPIAVNYEECLATFKLMRHWQTKYNNFFELSTQQYFHITYEDLVDNTEQETNRIQEFIEVDKHTLTAYTKKQGIKAMRELVANYDRLKEKFQKSCWSEFFDE